MLYMHVGTKMVRNVVISGGGIQIGKVIASMLGRRGDRIIIIGRLVGDRGGSHID